MSATLASPLAQAQTSAAVAAASPPLCQRAHELQGGYAHTLASREGRFRHCICSVVPLLCLVPRPCHTTVPVRRRCPVARAEPCHRKTATQIGEREREREQRRARQGG